MGTAELRLPLGSLSLLIGSNRKLTKFMKLNS